MNTTIIVDKKIRDKAAKKAKVDMLSVSAVARILLLDYADGKIQIGARIPDNMRVEEVPVDASIQEMMDDVMFEWNKK